MGKTLTVTVPAYNADQWLEYNLNSLCLRDCLEDLEIIIVDDGSSDRTGAIADEYAKRFPDTVRVIHKENGGHGSGVNAGIREARGRYFKVVDSDDWVEEESFRELLRYLKTADDDIVSSGFLWARDNGSGYPATFPTAAEMKEPFAGVEYRKSYRFDEIAERLYLKIHNLTWRTAILQEYEITLDEHCYYVDNEFITYPIPYAESVSFLPDFVYRYRIDRAGQSMSWEKLQKNASNYDRVLEALLSFYESDPVQKSSREKRQYIANIIARVAAARIRIFLSLPAGKENKAALIRFDQGIKKNHPEIYRANINKAVAALRKSRYLLYGAAAAAVKEKYGRTTV